VQICNFPTVQFGKLVMWTTAYIEDVQRFKH